MRPAPGGWRAGLLGAAAGGALVAVALRRAIWSPDLPAQAYDIVFHLNAVRWILDTGDASSLHVGRVTAPHTGVPYPAAWHDVVSLVVQLSGATILQSTNVVALVVCRGALAVVDRRPGGGRGAPLALGPVASGLVAAGFPAFPSLLLIWGVLYPTLLGYSLLPAVLAVLAALLHTGRTHRTDHPDARRPGAVVLVVLLVLQAPGVALTHPSVLFALAVVAAPLLVTAAALGAARAWGRPSGRRLVVASAAAVGALVVAAVVVVARSSVIASMSRYVWPATASPAQAVGEALLGATPAAPGHGSPAAAWVSVLALAGAAVLLQRRRERWLVASWLGAGALFVVGESTATSPLTGVWYNDAYRLAPLVAITAVPLAAAGLQAVSEAAAEVTAGPRTRREPARPRRLSLVAAAAAPVVCAGLALAAPGSGAGPTIDRLAESYRLGPSAVSPLVSADEVALDRRIPAEVPASAVIANDPYDGSSLVMGLADRTPLFTHFTGSWTSEQRLLGDHLDRVGTDPQVCAAARHLKVTYLLAQGQRYFAWLPRAPWFDGVRAAPDSGAFTLVDQVGEARLYRLTTCAGQPVP